MFKTLDEFKKAHPEVKRFVHVDLTGYGIVVFRFPKFKEYASWRKKQSFSKNDVEIDFEAAHELITSLCVTHPEDIESIVDDYPLLVERMLGTITRSMTSEFDETKKNST